MRGDKDQTRAVAATYGIAIEREDDGSLGHTALALVVDPRGNIRTWAPPDYSPNDFLADVQAALR